MKIYYTTEKNLTLKRVLTDLQNRRTVNKESLLMCPAVRDTFNNVFMLTLNKEIKVEYNLESAVTVPEGHVTKQRPQQFENTNIFNVMTPFIFFSDSPVKMKVTSPYFHQTNYQKDATFISGIFDIGKWFRAVQSEIITWQTSGEILFKNNEPLCYVEFITDEKIEFLEFNTTETLLAMSYNLVFSPYQTPENFQGSLDSRYKGFEESDYASLILDEIKANLVSKDEASPSV